MCGLLNSNVLWFSLKEIAIVRQSGYLEAKPVYIGQLPIPDANDEEKKRIGALAEQAQDTAEKRYAIQDRIRNRIHDIAPEGRQYQLNKKLKNWWTLDFKDFQKEVKKVFKRELSLKERDEWEEYLNEHKSEIEILSRTLTSIENEINNEVYKLFDLTPDEITLIEENV